MTNLVHCHLTTYRQYEPEIMGGQLLHTVQSFKYFNEIRPKCINLTSTTIQKVMRKNAKNMGKNIAKKNSGKKNRKKEGEIILAD